MAITQNPLPIPLEQLGVREEQFANPSAVHGAAHVNRVIFHALQIARMHGLSDYIPEIWAAAYLHDLARRHDGACAEHGRWAVEEKLPEYQAFFLQAGVKPERLGMVAEAVRIHSMEEEAPNNPVAVVLKDADALDRVRLGDLDESRLRLEYTPLLASKAFHLLARTQNAPDWMTIWNAGVALYNPHIGCAEKTPAPWNEQESGAERMRRRVSQSQFPPNGYLETVKRMPVIPDFARDVALPDVQLGAPVVYMRESALHGILSSGKFLSLWELAEYGIKGWHGQFSDNPEDGRAFNEARLFGECCRWTTYGVFLTPRTLPADPVLRQMYGEKRVRLNASVLESASFTIGDSQRNRFALPYSPENAALLLSMYAAARELPGIRQYLPGNEPPRYIELQIHQPLTAADIAAVE